MNSFRNETISRMNRRHCVLYPPPVLWNLSIDILIITSDNRSSSSRISANPQFTGVNRNTVLVWCVACVTSLSCPYRKEARCNLYITPRYQIKSIHSFILTFVLLIRPTCRALHHSHHHHFILLVVLFVRCAKKNIIETLLMSSLWNAACNVERLFFLIGPCEVFIIIVAYCVLLWALTPFCCFYFCITRNSLTALFNRNSVGLFLML